MKPWIQKIRKLMYEQGMTQEELASEIGRGQSWVNHKLSGRRKTNVDDIVLIAKALNIEPATLFENVTNMDRLKDNFLGVSEPEASYNANALGDLEAKIEKLADKDAKAFISKMTKELDILIAKK